MNFEMNLVQMLVITSVVNGLVYSILILFKKENRSANYFLSLLLVSLSFTFTPYFISGKYFQDFLWLSWLPFSLAYWIGPALFFYIRFLTNPAYNFPKKHLYHFLPIVLNYFHSLYHAIPAIQPMYPVHVLAEWLEYGSFISVFIYAWLSINILNGYNQSILSQLSSIENVHLHWLKNFIKILGSLFIVVLLYHIIVDGIYNKRYHHDGEYYLQPVLILYSVTMYWLTIGGYRQTQTLNRPIDLRFTSRSSSADLLIKSVNENKAFLNPELSLKGLSDSVNLSQSEISEIINQELGKNFYQFINEFRVEEAKTKLLDPSLRHLKIVSIAYDSGFNSKATFNRFFKQEVGMSPKEFINQTKAAKNYAARPEGI
ncbi:MAG: helix-turn-helix domain-containing protein [Ekhidna sp.]